MLSIRWLRLLSTCRFASEVAFDSVDSFSTLSLLGGCSRHRQFVFQLSIRWPRLLEAVNSLTEFVVNMIYLVEVFETHAMGETIGSNRQYPHRGVGRRLALVPPCSRSRSLPFDDC